jgi:checkpoint serine/threonine-protein kinase
MSVEFSFEELRAKHRGWMKMDWAAIRQEEADKANEAAEVSAAKQSRSKAATLAPKVQKESPKPQTVPLKTSIEAEFVLNDENAPPGLATTALKIQTVPLKGSIEDELVLNDENSPPSQAELEKAKSARKARKEERANRTRKIKVMEVKEIRAETQTSKSPTLPATTSYRQED